VSYVNQPIERWVLRTGNSKIRSFGITMYLQRSMSIRLRSDSHPNINIKTLVENAKTVTQGKKEKALAIFINSIITLEPSNDFCHIL